MPSTRQQRQPVVALRPRLELLEDRTVLSPGDLDPTFGVGGKVLTEFLGPTTSNAYAVAVQPDGKVVAGGSARVQQGGTSFGLARYHPDGSLDPSFGTGGQVTTVVGGYIEALAVQPDGRIVAAGTAFGPDGFGLARYTPDGRLDPSFGSGGLVSTQFGVSYVRAGSLVLQPDGKIIVSGAAPFGVSFLVRYNADGSLDATFGTDGRVRNPAALTWYDALTVQPDGRVVVAGTSGSQAFALARYTSSGTLDATFGAGGIVTTGYVNGTSGASHVALRPGGRIVAAGYFAVTGGGGFALTQYHADGSLDASFGTGGRVTTDFGVNSGASELVLRLDGKAVALGSVPGGAALVQYTAEGRLDPSFGAGGTVIVLPALMGAQGLALQADGRVIVSGGHVVDRVQNFGLARYTAGGSLDVTFGGGLVWTPFTGQYAWDALGLAVQADGKIVAVGSLGWEYDRQGFALARYTRDGSLDPSFGTGGQVTTHFDPLAAAAWEVVIQPDGKIVAAGDFGMARYRTDGSLDVTFGAGGKVLLPDALANGRALALQPDGKIVVAGFGGPTHAGAVARYNPDGSPDATFGTGGLATGFNVYSAGALALQPDGRIIVGGNTLPQDLGVPPYGTWSYFQLARLNPNGSRDTSFFSIDPGIIWPSYRPEVVTGIALQPDGRIVAVGYWSGESHGGGVVYAGLLARYDANGRLDPTFGDGGKVTGGGGLEAVALEPDGKIVAVGSGRRGHVLNWTSQILVERYDTAGRLDPSFGAGGKVLTDFAGTEDDGQFNANKEYAHAVALQPHGRIVVAATTRSLQNFALVRYLGGEQRQSTTVLTSSVPDSVLGQPVTLTATVAGPPGSPAPTGAITFYDGPAVLVTVNLDATGRATVITGALGLGTHSLTAVYDGDFHFAASTSAALAQDVTRIRTATALASSAFPGVFGQPVTFTATVRIDGWGAGTPTGTVTFHDGTTLLGTAPLDATGQATFSAALAVGPHTATASYSGDASFAPSTSAPLDQPAVCNPNQMFVAALYHDLLGRPFDTAGFNFWVSQLDAGMSREQVAWAVWASPEHRGVQVDRLYAALLHRPADPVGRTVWVTALQAGVSEELLAFNILASPEYRTAHPDLVSLITGLYRDVLGRDPDPAGLASWQAVGQLPLGRELVIAEFLETPEVLLRVIDSYYRDYLGRAADPAGQQAWLNPLTTGQADLANVALGILSSEEYYTVANQWDLHPLRGGRYCGKA